MEDDDSYSVDDDAIDDDEEEEEDFDKLPRLLLFSFSLLLWFLGWTMNIYNITPVIAATKHIPVTPYK